ncbi:Uncharacterized protein dnm_048640 [Desulfonema magnum]|uniref:Uncharacterized protein n=1 Tax=Desulfonema magnum TaxID=45655 RepID=A0A975BP29_9BACT|nr:Uncharacterized protein dnm_048640 [Desulfonema magnum]
MSEITAEGLRASQIKNSKVPYNNMERQQIIEIQQILSKGVAQIFLLRNLC